MKKSPFASFWTWFCLTALLLFIFYAPVIFADREFFVSDHCFYFEPFARYIASSYQSGHIPLWNPFCYCGNPQLANPSPGIFYLPNFLFVLFSYSRAMGLILVLQQLVAFSAGFLLIESLGWGALAAAFCGLLLALNGYMMSLSANYSLPGTFAWGVLAIYAAINIGRFKNQQNENNGPHKRAKQIGFVVLTALAVHFMLMAGRPEVFVPMMALIGALIGFVFLGWITPFEGIEKSGWKDRGMVFAWQIVGIILGVMLSAIMILPVYEWSKLSPRADGMLLVHVFNWSTNWYDLLCMICPQPLGDLQQPSKFLKLVASRSAHYPFLPSALIGPVAFSLAWLGMFDRSFKARFFILGGFVVSLVLAIGKYGPFATWLLKAVPFLSVLRYPCKLLIIVILFVVILGSRGLYKISIDAVPNWQKKFLLALWLVLLVVSAGLTFGNHFCAAHFFKFPPDLIYKLGYSLALTSAIGLFSSVVIAYGKKLAFAPGHIALIVVLLAGASIFSPAMKNTPRTVAAGFFAKPSEISLFLTKYREEARTESERKTGKPANAGVIDSQFGRYLPLYFDPLKVSDGYEPRYPNQAGEPFMQFARELLHPNTNIDSNVKEAFGYESAENKDYRDVFIKALHLCSVDVKNADDIEMARFCAITGTRYIGSQIENNKGIVSLFNAKRFKLVHEDTVYNFRIYEALTQTPRAYFAKTYRTVSSQEEAIKPVFAQLEANTPGNQCEYDRNLLVELDKKTDITGDWFDFGDKSQGQVNDLLNNKTAAEKPVPQFAKAAVTAADTTSKVQFLKDEPEHVSLAVSNASNGFFVLNDRFYPGWHAIVDTQPAPMYRANAFMRAVYLGKGSHLVEFVYAPESLRNGCYLALAALLIICLLLLIFGRPVMADFVSFLSTGEWPKSSAENL